MLNIKRLTLFDVHVCSTVRSFALFTVIPWKKKSYPLLLSSNVQCRCYEQLLSPMRCNKQGILKHVIKINNLVFCSGDLHIIDSLARPIGDVSMPMSWTKLNFKEVCRFDLQFQCLWIEWDLWIFNKNASYKIVVIHDDFKTYLLQNLMDVFERILYIKWN